MGDNSNYTVSKKCPGGSTSSNCVTWVGESIPCLGICKWDTLTELNAVIADKVCKLLTFVDLTGVDLSCFITTSNLDSSSTLVDFLDFLIAQLCTEQAEIDAINVKLQSIGDLSTQINPLITLDYKCCADDDCVTVGTVKLSVAMQNILNCLCNLNSLIGVLPNGQASVVAYIDSIKALVNAQNATISNMQTTINGINGTTIPNINSKLCILKDAVNHLIAGTPATTITFTC